MKIGLEQSFDSPAPSRIGHLLAVARRLFVAHGFDAVSLDGVAREAGVSKETIYRHFTNKEALFRATITGMYNGFSLRSNIDLGDEGKAEARLVDYARAIHDKHGEGGYVASVWLAISVADRMPDMADMMMDIAIDRLEPLRIDLEKIAANRGVSGAVPSALAADFGSLAVEGSRHLMGAPPLNEDCRDRLATDVAHLFVHGICAPAGRAPAAPPQVATPAAQPPVRPAHIATLLTVAARHFTSRGYQGASVDEIGAEAKVGRGTLYRHFTNKAGLFDAAMRDMAAQLVPEPWPVLPLSGSSGQGDPRRALIPYLEAASAVLTGAEGLALHRAVIAEARRVPALARDVHDYVREPWVTPLAEWLSSMAASTLVQPGDARWRASQLLTIASLGNRPLLTGHVPDQAARAQAVQRAIDIVFDGFTAVLERQG